MRPVERTLHLPNQTHQFRRDLFLVRRDGWGTENEIQHFHPRLLDLGGVLSAQQRLREMRMSEVDTVEFAIELRQFLRHCPHPRPASRPAVISRNTLRLSWSQARQERHKRSGKEQEGLHFHDFVFPLLICRSKAISIKFHLPSAARSQRASRAWGCLLGFVPSYFIEVNFLLAGGLLRLVLEN